MSPFSPSTCKSYMSKRDAPSILLTSGFRFPLRFPAKEVLERIIFSLWSQASAKNIELNLYFAKATTDTFKMKWRPCACAPNIY